MKDSTHWDTWHILHSSSSTDNCKIKCGDPLCKVVGCMDIPGYKFRADLMDGVRQHRKDGTGKYPLAVPTGRAIPCIGSAGTCLDPFCSVIGCMDQKGWQLRDLIKMGMKDELTVNDYKELD